MSGRSDGAVRRLQAVAGFAFGANFAGGLKSMKEYAALRREQMSDPDVVDALPFWQYMTVGDDRVRPSHAILDGFTALATDPVWKGIYPRGGKCRCIVIPLLASEAPPNAREDGMTRLRLLRGELTRKNLEKKAARANKARKPRPSSQG